MCVCERERGRERRRDRGREAGREGGRKRERERESFLLVIFELERVHVYLAQAINLNLPESFALNVNARNSTHT